MGDNGWGKIAGSYSTGTVASSSPSESSAGGLVGKNGRSIKESYRNEEATVTAKRGSGNGIITTEGTPLSPRQMTGTGNGRANDLMKGLDTDIWGFQQDDDESDAPDSDGNYSQTWYYPRLKAMAYTEDSKPKYLKTGRLLSSGVSKLTITGTAAVGQILEAEVEGTKLEDLKYQWYVEGVGISGTGKTYKVQDRDAGKTVSAEVYKATHLGTLEASVRIPCSVVITNPADSHIRWASGSQSQSGLIGAMESVVYETELGYYFPEDYSISTGSGIQVKRDGYTKITISGTPTANSSFTLTAATEKAAQEAPSGLSDGVGKINGTTAAMEYASSPDAQSWTPCQEGATAVGFGTWYVRYRGTDTQKVGSPASVTVTAAYTVKIINPAGSHITRSGGAEQQEVAPGKTMDAVVYTADSGYYFPEDYSISTVNGIQAKRDSYTKITVSGKPTAHAALTLTAATGKAAQEAPSGLSGGVGKINGTTESMEYASSPDAQSWTPCQEGATAVGSGTWYVRYRGTATKKAGSPASVTVTAAYTVKIINPAGSHITRSGGAEQQEVAPGKTMDAVVYTAASGYYFPENHSISTVNGIQAKRESYTKITVSGKPTAHAALTLTAATEKAAQEAPSGLGNGEDRISGTTGAMEYAPSSQATKWSACKNGGTAVKAGTWYVRYKATETKRAGTAAKITVAPIPPKASKTKVSTTYNSVKVSWGKASGAVGYQVYRANGKNGKYKKAVTTGKTSWVNKKLVTGKAYHYKVRAYKKLGGKTIYGSFSNKVKAVPRTKAPAFKLTAGNDKMRVSWKKASGADGYCVYRAKRKDGKYKMVKDSRSRLKRYTSIRLTDHHRYYYKMRSYKFVKGKKVYSTYSKAKSKKTR